MEKKLLDLWYAYPEDLLAEDVAAACASLLSEDEHARWQRFRFEHGRREYLATHALVRTALSHYREASPEHWRFTQNEFGKPAVDPDCGLRFNLANSRELVVCLVAEGAEVGVDVEPHTRRGQIAEVAKEVFSPFELAQLDALNEEEKLDRGLSLWTLKESYIKARGMGLSLQLKKFSFLFGGAEGIHLELDPSLDDNVERWRFCLLEHAGHRIAVMTERDAARDLQIWETRPLLAPPALRPECVAQWFPTLQSDAAHH
jgi:4'-phosphopantetheinyl transferase